MNNNHPNSNGGKFLNGFLLGALIGAGVIFLLGTEKGKKILKTITDEGLGLSELLKEEDLDDDLDEDIPEVKKEDKKKCKNCQEQNVSVEKKIIAEVPKIFSDNDTLSKIAKSGRRFFKGVRRKN